MRVTKYQGVLSEGMNVYIYHCSCGKLLMVSREDRHDDMTGFCPECARTHLFSSMERSYSRDLLVMEFKILCEDDPVLLERLSCLIKDVKG